MLTYIVAALFSVAFFFLRLRSTLRYSPPIPRAAGPPSRILVVLGSGGHTAELLLSLQSLPTSRYSHRTYLISSGDVFSETKADAFEETLRGLAELRRKPYGSYDVALVPRARRVHQSLVTTPWSCIQCFIVCIRVLAIAPVRYQNQWQTYASQLPGIAKQQSRRRIVRPATNPFPDLIITNGPATGLMITLAALLLRFTGIGRPRSLDGGGGMRTIFIESWARVKGLSLTGRILVATGACQRVLVQWQGLKGQVGKGVEFIGPLVR